MNFMYQVSSFRDKTPPPHGLAWYFQVKRMGAAPLEAEGSFAALHLEEGGGEVGDNA